MGRDCDVRSEAADVVAMENSSKKVDEFMHISRPMRTIALESAIAGMASGVVGLLFAGMGHLPPVASAVSQELIDILAALNALRAALPPKLISDFD